MELITGTNLLLSLALIAQPPQSFNSAPLNRSALEQNAEINAPVEKTTRITISSDSKVIILSGDIEQGAADRFKIVLDAASSVNTVSLISPGGLLTEADKISKLIKMRGLDTYVDQICMSACTMIFLGGSQRFATPQAKFGFHQPYVLTDSAIGKRAAIESMQRFYDEASVRPSFTDRAMATPSSEMWYPTFDELMAAHVVTKQTLGGETTAFYGLMNDRSEIVAALLNDPTFLLLKEKHSEVFEGIVSAGWGMKLRGTSDAGISQAMRDKLAENSKIILRHAKDETLLKYLSLASDQTRAARSVSYDACYLFTQGRLNIQQTLAPEMWKRELAMLNEAMSEGKAAASEWHEPSEETWLKVFDGMPEDQLIAISDPSKSNKIDVCNAMIKMYDNLESFPEIEKIEIAKYMFLSN